MWETLLALLVFSVAAMLDFAYTRWISAIREKQRWPASTWAVIVGGMGWVLGEAVYNHSSWYVILELTGFFFGTAVAVKPDE